MAKKSSKSDDYEYHKQNDYPGERVAEKERVAHRKNKAKKRADARVAEKSRTEGLKADNRVARKGRRKDKLMDAEIRRSDAEAARLERKRHASDLVGLAVIAGLIIALLAGSIWAFAEMQEQSNEIDTLNTQLDKANSDNRELSLANRLLTADTDTSAPTILHITPLTSVGPSNNEVDVPTRVPITVTFSEDMNPLTINESTFTVEQRTTPAEGSDADAYRSLPIEGEVSYSNREATFRSSERFSPNQIYGNVFTVTVSDEVEDVAGNQLSNQFIWSFTTGTSEFNTGATTQQTN